MIGYVFPGQGAQHVGMGKDLYEAFQESRNVFDTADRVLKFPLSKLCFDGPIEELTRTVHCQPAIFTTSIAALAAFNKLVDKKKTPSPKYMAGLSLGEYTALVAAGVMTFEEGISLVANRAKFMDEAAEENPGKMVSILGLDLNVIKNIAKETGVEIANLNCPGQVVISGQKDSIDEFNRKASANGAKRVINLEVSGAFHCSLMDSAGKKLAEIINNLSIKEPEVAVVSNVTALPECSLEQIKENLIKQVTCSVFWEKSVRFMIEQGIKEFIEIGPGKILKGLIRKIDNTVKVINIERKEDIIQRNQKIEHRNQN